MTAIATAIAPAESTVTGDHSNTAALTVADASPFWIGFTLTVPETNAEGTITTTTRVITNIAGTTLTLAGPLATAASLGFAAGSGTETLADDATVTAAGLMNAPSGDSRLLYLTNPLERPVRISGTSRVTLTAAFTKAKANLTAHLVSLPEAGNGTILTRGWIDPENRSSDWASVPVTPGRFYRLRFDLQAKDVVVPAGRRLGLMVLSSDRDLTVRPAPGTQVTVDLARSGFTLPVVGGAQALEPARL